MYDPEAPEPGDITGPTPVKVKDPRPQRVTSTASKDPNHVRKFINDLHAEEPVNENYERRSKKVN